MENTREKILEMFDDYFNAIEKEYKISDESKRTLKDRIKEDIIEIN